MINNMTDLEKVEKFCSQIRDNDNVAYPTSLKNFFGISEKTKSTLLKVIEEYQRDHEVDESGYVESELVKRFLEPATFLKKKSMKLVAPFLSIKCLTRSILKYFICLEIHISRLKVVEENIT